MSMPKPYIEFGKRYPDLIRDFESIGVKCLEAGPLDPRARHLVKLGMAIATGSKGGIKSQTRKALEGSFSHASEHFRRPKGKLAGGCCLLKQDFLGP